MGIINDVMLSNSKNKLVGIDGCKYGWVAVCLKDDCARLFKNFADVIKFYPHNTIFIIDIPIGLADADSPERNCEMIARKKLSKERKSSLFSVPCRESIYTSSYEEANRINKEILRKGISKQSWGIVPKIREIDKLLQQDKSLISRTKESHPEVAFHFLNNQQSMQYNKKSEMGQVERLKLLSTYSDKAENIFKNSVNTFKRKDVSPDDILDSVCLAVTLENMVYSGFVFEEDNLDSSGIPMKIHYFM